MTLSKCKSGGLGVTSWAQPAKPHGSNLRHPAHLVEEEVELVNYLVGVRVVDRFAEIDAILTRARHMGMPTASSWVLQSMVFHIF